jgi:hypothetical protein
MSRIVVLRAPCLQDLGAGLPYSVEEIAVRVPFELPKIEELPSENDRRQYALRPDGFEVARHLYEQVGWTVEYHSTECCEWADVWIVAVITQRPKYPPTLHPAAVEKVPAINLVLEDAMRLAREFNDARRPTERATQRDSCVCATRRAAT